MSLLLTNLAAVRAMLDTLPALDPQVEAASRAIADALLAGRKLLACGNGGSAADSAHLTTEFVCRYSADRRPYPAISLASQGGDLTAIGNDYSFDQLFARQVRAFGLPGDVLCVFSTSGASENVRLALLAGREMGLTTISFLGRDGGRCAGLAGIEMIVAGSVTARIQEAHKLLLHTICEAVEVDLQAAEGR